MSTEIVIVGDRSGSMYGISEQASNAINEYINEQKNGPDDCYVTVWQFDTVIERVVPRTKIEDCPRIKLNPRGLTALYDAAAKAINHVQTEIKRRRKKHPNVIIVIQTDGHENASKEYQLSTLKKLIKETEKKNYQYVFLGANFTGDQGEAMGISNRNSVSFNNTPEGYFVNYKKLSTETSNLRSAKKSGREYSITMK